MNKVSAKCDIVQSISLGGEWDYYVVLSSFLSRARQAVSEADGADTSKLIFDNEHISPDSEFQTKLPPNNHNHNVNTEKAQQSSSECRSLAQLSRGPPPRRRHTHTHTHRQTQQTNPPRHALVPLHHFFTQRHNTHLLSLGPPPPPPPHHRQRHKQIHRHRIQRRRIRLRTNLPRNLRQEGCSLQLQTREKARESERHKKKVRVRH